MFKKDFFQTNIISYLNIKFKENKETISTFIKRGKNYKYKSYFKKEYPIHIISASFFTLVLRVHNNSHN